MYVQFNNYSKYISNMYFNFSIRRFIGWTYIYPVIKTVSIGWTNERDHFYMCFLKVIRFILLYMIQNKCLLFTNLYDVYLVKVVYMKVMNT